MNYPAKGLDMCEEQVSIPVERYSLKVPNDDFGQNKNKSTKQIFSLKEQLMGLFLFSTR